MCAACSRKPRPDKPHRPARARPRCAPGRRSRATPGPGIGRGEYGGFLMSLPARRMYDVWQDPDYEFAESKSERLLVAGMDYSVHRHVVYVPAKPPRTIFRSIAARLGRTIMYI